MLKISQIISLPIINIYELKVEGYVEKALINPTKKQVEFLIVYDEINDIYKSINFSDIYQIGNDAIMIRNSSKITLFENTELLQQSLTNPINANCYLLNGQFLGKVNEIIINANATIKEIIANDKQYTLNNIIGINNDIILISLDKPVSIKKFKNFPKKLKSLIHTQSEPIVTIMENKPIEKESNYSFLLNRKILKDIKIATGEIVAKKDSVVSINLINKLKYYGKLKELTLNSK